MKGKYAKAAADQPARSGPYPPSTPKPCPYFPLGKCEKGDSCKWAHIGAPSPSDESTDKVVELPSNGSQNKELCPFFAAGACQKGLQCRWRHAVGSQSGGEGLPAGRACPFFAAGKCEKGADCRWSHVLGGQNFALAKGGFCFAGGGGGGRSFFAPAQGGEGQLCPFFAAGRCEKGPECRWRHAVGSKAGGDGIPPGQKCPYFALGKCEKPNCKWSHE